MGSSGPESAAAARPPGPAAPGPAAALATVDADVHHDIARDIGQQVEVMILDAKRQSESKVGKEVQKIKTKMEAMSEKIKMVKERVNRLEPGSGGLLKVDLQKSIAKLEEVWEGEVGTLKHELWQTIQAHNHNADLLKHHKDAIDQLQLPAQVEQVHSQLLQVDKVMQREVAKEQQMDQLMQRITVLQQQLSAGVGHWAGGGMAPPFPMTQAAAAAAAAAATSVAAATGKQKAKRQAAKPKPKAAPATASMQAAAAAASLRAEAPEFVPNTAGWSDA